MSDDHFVYFHNVRNNIIIRSLFHSPSALSRPTIMIKCPVISRPVMNSVYAAVIKRPVIKAPRIIYNHSMNG